MLDDFVVRAALAGLGVAIAAAPLGCFILWRRMAYLGDATAHAAILGVALALSFDVSIYLGVIAVAVLVAIMVSTLSGARHAEDTLLGVAAHAGLALGIVIISLQSDIRGDLFSYLFGDILAIRILDLAVIWLGAGLATALVVWRWTRLLTATLNAELASASGINPRHEQLMLTLATALIVAVAIKVVGALLITAMLITPAAAARSLARSPEVMAMLGCLIGAVSVGLGLAASYYHDTPAGPSIVTAGLIFFAITSLLGLFRRD